MTMSFLIVKCSIHVGCHDTNFLSGQWCCLGSQGLFLRDGECLIWLHKEMALKCFLLNSTVKAILQHVGENNTKVTMFGDAMQLGNIGGDALFSSMISFMKLKSPNSDRWHRWEKCLQQSYDFVVCLGLGQSRHNGWSYNECQISWTHRLSSEQPVSVSGHLSYLLQDKKKIFLNKNATIQGDLC